MVLLLLGLLLFLGPHSVRIFAPNWRQARMAAWGEWRWKGGYSVLVGVGLALIVIGYGQARQTPLDWWTPPVWTRHVAALLTLPSMVLFAASFVPGTIMTARLHHPMVLGVKLWAAAHLLANGRLADVVLFGAFLVWAVLNFRVARQRDRAGLHPVPPPGRVARDVVAVLLGLVVWGLLIRWGHVWLIGVQPLPWPA